MVSLFGHSNVLLCSNNFVQYQKTKKLCTYRDIFCTNDFNGNGFCPYMEISIRCINFSVSSDCYFQKKYYTASFLDSVSFSAVIFTSQFL